MRCLQLDFVDSRIEVDIPAGEVFDFFLQGHGRKVSRETSTQGSS